MAIKLNITYNGSTIAEIVGGQTATLACKDKKMLSDLVFEAVAVEDVTLISFTIAGTSYQAEEGMIWYEWANSDYNTGGWVCSDYINSVTRNLQAVTTLSGDGSSRVYGEDTIVADFAYGIYSMQGGGSN